MKPIDYLDKELAELIAKAIDLCSGLTIVGSLGG